MRIALGRFSIDWIAEMKERWIGREGVNSMAKAQTQSAWQARKLAMQGQGKKGGYNSDKNMDFNKTQSIEELTGGRLKKK